MSILEYLYDRYGKDKIDKLFYYLPSDKNYKILMQHLRLSEPVDNNYSCYRSLVLSKLETKIEDKLFLYEISNIIASIDYTFKQYNTIITYGTFDLFHVGHVKLLERISGLCNNLIVGVSTDEFNQLKGKQCAIPYEQRKAIVCACKYVTKVIPENNWDQKSSDIEKYQVDALVMGDDWKGKFDFLKSLCDVIYLPRTDGISTTMLKEKLRD